MHGRRKWSVFDPCWGSRRILTRKKNRELKRKNEERKEKREVKALLLSDYDSDDYDSDDSMDGLGYVPDSEGYLLLVPEAPDSDCPNRR